MLCLSIICLGLSVATSVWGCEKQGDRFMDFRIGINQASATVSRRVTGGIEMSKDEFSSFNYQAGMYITKQDGTLSICGAAIVHPEMMLTAAHCVDKAKKLKIFVGAYIKPIEYDSSLIKVDPENIVVHENYDDWTLENDIALIRLPSPLQMSASVGVIKLASYNWTTCDNGTAWVSGWGKTTDSDYSIPDVMNYLQVEPISYEKCYSFYTFLNRGQQLCSSGDLFKGICPGDSGGPYAFENEYGNRYLCGLNSFVANIGCINNLPKGYSSVAYYNDNGWICKNSGGLVGC